MVEVGELQITGELDDSGISQGFTRINADFSNLENQANQTNASLGKMSGIAKGMATTFLAMGTIAVGSMTALATKSPVLAGTFARIGMESFKLGNTIARQLKPAFDSMVGLFSTFNQALTDSPNLLGSVADTTSEAMGDISSAISGEWNKISNIIPKTGGVAAGIRLGAIYPGGIHGMLLGAALGYVAGDLVGEHTPIGPLTDTFINDVNNSQNVFREVKENPDMFSQLTPFQQKATEFGDFIFRLTEGIKNGFINILTLENNKEVELTSANGTGP